MFQMWKMKIPEKKWLIFFQKNAEVTEKKLDQLWISGSKTIASFHDTMCRGTHSLLTEEIEEYSVSSGLVILAAVYHYAMPQSVIPLKHCQWQSLKTVTYYSLLSPIILVSQDVSFSNSTYFSQKTAETLVYFPFCEVFLTVISQSALSDDHSKIACSSNRLVCIYSPDVFHFGKKSLWI